MRMLLQRQFGAKHQQEIKTLLKQLAVMPEGQADLDNKTNVRALLGRLLHIAHVPSAILIALQASCDLSLN